MQHGLIDRPHAQERKHHGVPRVEDMRVAAPDVEPVRAPLVRDGVDRLALLHAIGAALDGDTDAVVVVEGKLIPALGDDAVGVGDCQAEVVDLRGAGGRG